MRCPPLATLLAAGLLAAAGLAAPARATPEPPEVRRARGETRVTGREEVDDPAELLEGTAYLARAGRGMVEELFARAERSTRGLELRATDLSARAQAAGRRLSLHGPGLPLHTAPLILREVVRLEETGRSAGSPKSLVRSRLKLFARASGLSRAPNLGPVYGETVIDGEGREVLRGRAFAAGLLAQVELSAELLSSSRLATVGGRRVSLAGRSPEEGFEGLCHLLGASARLDALRVQLAFDGESFDAVDPKTYDPFAKPRWLPVSAILTRSDDAVTIRIGDPKSELGTQALCLIAAARYAELSSPSGPLSHLFGVLGAGGVQEEIFRPDAVARARALCRYLYLNLVAFHFDPAPVNRFFVSRASLGDREPELALADAGLVLEALSLARQTLSSERVLFNEAGKLIEAQAGRLLRLIAKGPLPDIVQYGGGQDEAAPEASPGALAQAARGLLAAAAELGDEALADGAGEIVRRLEVRRFDPWAGLYLGTDPTQQVVVGPRGACAQIALLRDLGLERSRPEAIARLEETAGALGAIGVLPDPAEGTAWKVTVEVAR